jgi:hypothetical protein
MSERAELTLVWPPRSEDLERLYVEEHLSAAKIARRYGLKYASPKTAESTVLYQLKRAGIKRRDCAEHVRKVTEEMADEWVRRYQAGESLKQIAGGRVDAVTVFNHLHKRGLALRDKVEAQIEATTTHQRKPFFGNDTEKAYLLGFVLGDCSVIRHGRAIRVRTSTTHPAMTGLFQELFRNNGYVHSYPRKSKLTGYQWSLEVDLDASFQFLLDAKERSQTRIPDDEDGFLSYLAGFFDAEGGIYLHLKRYGSSFEFHLTNTQEGILRQIYQRLRALGYSPVMRSQDQAENRLGGRNPGTIWRLKLWKQHEVHDLTKAIPSRHQEKVMKIRVASEFLNADSFERRIIAKRWLVLIERIKEGRNRYVSTARIGVEGK